jgi:hypothetical protein
MILKAGKALVTVQTAPLSELPFFKKDVKHIDLQS